MKSRFSKNGIRYVDFTPEMKLVTKLKGEWQEYVNQIPPYQGGFSGKGIVICAGGLRYFTCAWVNISLLRKHGCVLPIEVWYTGQELTPESIAALRELNVVCKNADDFASFEVKGWVLKPFAIINSSFKEVLFLDADNNCAVDPTYLFDCNEYQSFGAIFWPDAWLTDTANPIWQVIESTDYNSVEQESGQILINKERCWKELNLCMYFNLKKDYYYTMLHGDKDTFRFAWMALKTAYYMINTPVAFGGYYSTADSAFIGISMVQHDCNGKMIFLHRNLLKWDITKSGERIWKEIKRFKVEAKEKFFAGGYFKAENGLGIDSMDIHGDTEMVPFADHFGNLELDCLDILEKLRSAPFYARLIIDYYFQHYRSVFDDTKAAFFKKNKQAVAPKQH
jgi:alpha 1,2-mannosyltransferase